MTPRRIFRVTIGNGWKYDGDQYKPGRIREVLACAVEMATTGALLFLGPNKEIIYAIGADYWVTVSDDAFPWPDEYAVAG